MGDDSVAGAQHDSAGVADDIIYQQAMETFRSILDHVVSTAGVFATAAVAIIAVAVERDSSALVGVSSVFPAAIYLLFRRWRRFDEIILQVAAAKELNREGELATGLRGWRSDAWFVNHGPLVATGALIVWATVWWIA